MLLKMVNSLFLNNYSPLIISFNTILGVLLSERDAVFKKINYIGLFLLFLGFLIYYNQLYEVSTNNTKKLMIPICLGVIFLAYCLNVLHTSKYGKSNMYFKYALYVVIIAFFLTFGWAISESQIDSANTQYIFFSILGVLFTLLYLIPVYRDKCEIFSFSLPLFSFFFIVLVFTSITTPSKN